MRYRVAAVGPLRQGYARTGCRHYLARLEKMAPVQVDEVRASPKAVPEDARARETAELFRRADGHVVALDERGRAWRTDALAAHVGALELGGVSRITLLIGGAEGLSEQARQRADDVWRLADLTLPHELARLVLLEQLYRIETLRAGHPYHRE